jgi:S-phase kinase-associated protein 1
MEDDYVTLVSKDEQDFKLEVGMAKKFETVEKLIEDSGVEDKIPLKEVTGKILSKIVEYLQYHYQNGENSGKDIIGWDLNFFKMDDETLFSIILAANYLDYPELLDACCKVVANEIKGKTPEEIRKRYNIEN